MNRPTVSIHNTATDEIIVREYTDKEFTDYKASQIAREEAEIAEKNRATAKAELLARLGLTEAEAKLLLA